MNKFQNCEYLLSILENRKSSSTPLHHFIPLHTTLCHTTPHQIHTTPLYCTFIAQLQGDKKQLWQMIFLCQTQKLKKCPVPIIFGKLICGRFGILMSQYGQVKKSCSYFGCAKMVIWLHTARTGSPDTLQTHPSASDFHEYHSDTPRHPPDIPQTPPQISPVSTRC